MSPPARTKQSVRLSAMTRSDTIWSNPDLDSEDGSWNVRPYANQKTNVISTVCTQKSTSNPISHICLNQFALHNLGKYNFRRIARRLRCQNNRIAIQIKRAAGRMMGCQIPRVEGKQREVSHVCRSGFGFYSRTCSSARVPA